MRHTDHWVQMRYRRERYRLIIRQTKPILRRSVEILLMYAILVVVWGGAALLASIVGWFSRAAG